VKVLSLSFRLFGNIFAGIVLIGVITFLSGKLQVFDVRFGEILVLPFWFFELFVAFIQAFVFFLLTSTYLKEARSHEH
jgi:F-type H+-transporting ATPase subunit a